MNASNLDWYAVGVKSRCEKAVSQQLREKGFEEFLPMYSSRRRWSDRVKVLDLPLFAGYLFCRFDMAERVSILSTPGVFQIAGCGRTPLPIEAQEIENIRMAVGSGLRTLPWHRLEIGQRVRIETGSLCGVEGTLLRHKGYTQIILNIELMQRAVAVEIDESWVVPCGSPTPVEQHFEGSKEAYSDAELTYA